MKAVRWGLLAAICCTLSTTIAWSQSDLPTRYCGVQMGRSEWLQKYQASPESYRKGLDTILYIPLTIHIVGNDNGSGYYSMGSLIKALCTLNEDFAQANIHFFVEGEVRYINNSAYYNHETVLEGAEMMFAENVPNTLNCYFVNDPAGNCGYNLPYAGIAVRKSCAGPNDHTWSHEAGHALKLPHPFLGWEGGVSWDGSIAHNFNDPAPLRVTYDYTFFKDTLILDTLIIDTAFVEWVDGSNCDIAADGFCDTSPDYLAARWTCDNNGQSPTSQKDPNGVTFRSNGSYIMGYANDACQAIFTTEQRAAMRAFLLDRRANWLYDQSPAPLIADEEATLLYPTPTDIVPNNAANLIWSAVEGATQYQVEISRLASFPTAVTDEYITTDTFLNLPVLQENRTYFCRIKPFNDYSHCAEASQVATFLTGVPVGVRQPLGLVNWQILPNPLHSHQSLYLDYHTDQITAPYWQVRLLDALGQPCFSQQITVNTHHNRLELALPNKLAPGMYWVEITDGQGIATQKLIVQ